jgi:hypothetical protein
MDTFRTGLIHSVAFQKVGIFSIHCFFPIAIPKLHKYIVVVVVGGGDQGPEPRLRLHCSH